MISFTRSARALAALMSVGLLLGSDRFDGIALPPQQPEPDYVQFAGCLRKIGEAYVVYDDASGKAFEIRGVKKVGRYVERHVSKDAATVMHGEHRLFESSALVVSVDKFDGVTGGCGAAPTAGAAAGRSASLKLIAVRSQPLLLLLQLLALPLSARVKKGR